MTRVISLSDDAYDELKRLKHEGDSFSDVVRRIVKKERPSLMKFAGKWKGTKEEIDTIFKDITEKRHKSKIREVTF